MQIHKGVVRRRLLATMVQSQYNLAAGLVRSKSRSVLINNILVQRSLIRMQVPPNYNANAGYSLIVDFGKMKIVVVLLILGQQLTVLQYVSLI